MYYTVFSMISNNGGREVRLDIIVCICMYMYVYVYMYVCKWVG